MTKIILIAALTPEGVIGRDQGIPWRMPSHTTRLLRLTLEHTILMGRKTYGRLIYQKGAQLPARGHLVLTKHYHESALKYGGIPLASPEEVQAFARKLPVLYVLGGRETFESMLPFADELYLTIIGPYIEGDAYFPPRNRADWKASDGTPEDLPELQDSHDEFPSVFVIYERRGQK